MGSTEAQAEEIPQMQNRYDQLTITLPSEVFGWWGDPPTEVLERLTPEQRSAYDEWLALGERLTTMPEPPRVVAMESLESAFANQYSRPPDYSLLILVGSILFEPVDWIATAVDVFTSLREEDYANAALNIGLALLPFVNGRMDDFSDGLRYAPDEPPSSGDILPSSAGDDAADIAHQAGADNIPTIPEGRLNHIFADRAGHITDTPQNRQLLIDTASDSANYVDIDNYGTEWYAAIRSDGSQVWVQVRDGQIRNGGVNITPREWNENTGLSAPQRP